ncbi:MAG: cytidylate kinase-like family protein [Lachnospiraceae bacterium]|nr:cytidylate kinase-like family protein [Lachnospiraceae bacterium]
MEKNIVFTIERQYGSGGRTIGQRLAEELGIHFYDKELVHLASEESGISEEMFRKLDEKPGKKIGIFSKIYQGEVKDPTSDDFTSNDNLFNLAAATIKKLADSSSCVIVGRAADFILKDYDNVVRIFVHADMDFLMEQAGKKQPYEGEELRKFIEKTDKTHAEYYKYHTGHNWEDARNYDICLNSGVLGFDKCLEAIKDYTRIRYGKF